MEALKHQDSNITRDQQHAGDARNEDLADASSEVWRMSKARHQASWIAAASSE